MSFSVEIHQNEYLAEGASEMHAVVRVTSSGGQGVAAPSDKVVVLVVDTSGSMGMPSIKIAEAKKSAANALRLLPDGTLFALVAGSAEARCVYPPSGQGLVRADERTRAEAGDAAARLLATGGTAISTWLDLVRTLVEPYPDAIRLAMLLTDGKNESETPEALAAAIKRAVGIFQCDTRGVGADYAPAELGEISGALLGHLGMIRTAEEMGADFLAFMDRAIGRNIGDVKLRIWTAKVPDGAEPPAEEAESRPQGAVLKLLKQVAPDIVDLLPSGVPNEKLASDYPTGAWSGDERRDYHLIVPVRPGKVNGDAKAVARAQVIVEQEILDQGLVLAVWTDDLDRSTRVNRVVDDCIGSEELVEDVRAGLDALAKDRTEVATAKLGRARHLAKETDNQPMLALLDKFVEVDARGTMRLKPKVDPLDVTELDTRSTRTAQIRKPPEPER